MPECRRRARPQGDRRRTGFGTGASWSILLRAVRAKAPGGPRGAERPGRARTPQPFTAARRCPLTAPAAPPGGRIELLAIALLGATCCLRGDRGRRRRTIRVGSARGSARLLLSRRLLPRRRLRLERLHVVDARGEVARELGRLSAQRVGDDDVLGLHDSVDLRMARLVLRAEGFVVRRREPQRDRSVLVQHARHVPVQGGVGHRVALALDARLRRDELLVEGERFRPIHRRDPHQQTWRAGQGGGHNAAPAPHPIQGVPAMAARYVDGFVLPIPKKNLATYIRMAKLCSKIWLDHGALRFRECRGEDFKWQAGVPFPKLAKTKPGETV